MRLLLLLLVLATSLPVQCQWYYPGMMYPGMMYPGMGWGYPGMMRPWGWGYGYRRSEYTFTVTFNNFCIRSSNLNRPVPK
ncbi:hypothetical protein Y032_0131g1579 [Ancylostoma ceylanicum]|uniref:Sulfur globule protein CV3 domain protein n=1 Tax=Ancylostoma ceylanicum TaxID=53326 RepID=A0A016T5U7_9BILA|nr:hypothetical protein Y032_0131g1579 [Ancylostoma ceylanicum]